MSYYDNIAKQRHEFTGYKGGIFKELVLNNLLIEKIPEVNNYSLLELGAGNRYFMPLMLKCFSGQVPSEIIITDKSERLFGIAKRYFRIPDAEYLSMDVCRSFPFVNDRFDLLIASMIFNEFPPHCFRNALTDVIAFLKVIVYCWHPYFIRILSAACKKESYLEQPKTGY